MLDHVAAVRRFSRFYTRQIGVLHEGYLQAPYSLTESRVLYELGKNGRAASAARLGEELGLDPAYLSRILRRFETSGLIERRPSPDDARQSTIELTAPGHAAAEALNASAQRDIGAMLDRLTAADRDRLAAALRTAERLLDGTAAEPAAPFLLRPHRIGDMGWITHRQALLYAQEYGWDASFEGLVAEIVGSFIQNYDQRRERCWIAERDEQVVGSVFLVRETDELGKLRLLYVEPAARGLGIGAKLVHECVHTARQLGYRRLTLWTNDVLTAARAIYQRAGFQLTASEPHHSFGHDLIGQHWELTL